MDKSQYSFREYVFSLVSFKTRLNRQKFWIDSIAMYLLAGPLILLATAAFQVWQPIGWVLMLGAIAAIFVSGVSLQVRRFWDLNMHPAWIIGLPIPGVGVIIALMLMFMKGTTGPNKYGPDPISKAPTVETNTAA